MSDRRGRVLLVEDNEALADNVCEILEDLEVDVTVAPTAAAALEAGGGFDLALLDVQLPDASGLELLPQLRNRAPHAEMVLMTGQGSLESAIEAVRHGAFAYLLKPFDPDALLGTAERALAQVALRRERSALSRALSASEALYRGVVESADVLIVGL
ncbi:MAG TPA: response regulator, partial [Polyangiaceae bacterium LLY-WYZ-15_(1-7)]|nr:response regulator [Polyangiaceae bacterium LLY-WYZ-15_(1-7)]